MTVRELIKDLVECIDMDATVEVDTKTNEYSLYSSDIAKGVIDCGNKVVITSELEYAK